MNLQIKYGFFGLLIGLMIALASDISLSIILAVFVLWYSGQGFMPLPALLNIMFNYALIAIFFSLPITGIVVGIRKANMHK